MLKTLFPAVALLAAASSAQAVSYVTVNGAPDPGIGANEQVFVNFDSPIASTGWSVTGSYNIANGSNADHAAPAGDTSNYFYVSSALATDTATLTSAANLKTVGFYWGSIDTYNTVEVLGTRNGGSTQTLYTLAGPSLPPANGNQQFAGTNRRVTFTAGKGEAITGLRFTSNGVAFEIDDIAGTLLGSGSASAVPEPTSWALLMGGFALVGAASRRRRNAVQVAA